MKNNFWVGPFSVGGSGKKKQKIFYFWPNVGRVKLNKHSGKPTGLSLGSDCETVSLNWPTSF